MAAVPMFDFAEARSQLSASITKVLENGTGTEIQDTYKNLAGSDNEKKAAADQAFRDILFDLLRKEGNCDKLKQLITIATESVIQETCSPSAPFIMLSDIFDGITLDKCSDLFSYVEGRVDTWKSDTFHTAGKNYLLRMCNDLSRRLSKSQNTLFSGRIQLFLARLFPLSEKSGLNLMSQFNLENTTYFNTKPEDYARSRKQSLESDKDESMEIEEGEMDEMSSSIPIDYNLYKKFWLLQDYFRRPNQCYEKVAWKTFLSYSDAVLNCFDSYKLDDTKASKKKLEQPRDTQTHEYFAKYLTSEKLLDLQLSDSNFRRYVLVQFLILFQYLGAQVKFKSTNQVLNEDQTAWMEKTTEKVYNLLKETPPDGDKFAKVIKHILSREENWNAWKNDGCPSYVREKSDCTSKPMVSKARKRSLGDDLKASGGKLIKMGNSELTRLWNLCSDNMEACRAKDRAFLPCLEEFFEDAILQADPEQQVEEQYKLVNNTNWSWKALRLLARRSPNFFTVGNNVGKNLPQYLEAMLSKLAKDKPGHTSTQPAGEMNAEVPEEEEIREEQTEENLDKADEQGLKEDTIPLVSKEQTDILAGLIDADWKKLATEFNFPDDDIAYFGTISEDVKAQALQMLTIWVENEGERATIPAMKIALKEIGLAAISAEVFGEQEDNA